MKLTKILKTILNETVYGLGLGGSDSYKYSSEGDSGIKAKTISILESGAWKKTEAGAYAIKKAKELTDMWNAKDPSERPVQMKNYAVDEEGNLKESNFIQIPALIIAVLDVMTKRISNVEWVGIKGKRNQCFQNAINYAKEIDGSPVGGIVLPKDQVGKYYTDRIIVHAFTKKANQYYEVTFPQQGITETVIYWPLVTFNKDSTEEGVATTTWSYALGIEEGIKEYFNIQR